MGKKKHEDTTIEHDSYGKIIVIEEDITEDSISKRCFDWVMLHAANKNLYRAFPSMIDGLKPVHRRILYAMHESGCMTKLKKGLKIIGAVSEFHPHGDGKDAFGKLAQGFSNNIPLITGVGNFGSINGDDVGALRYIEAKISEFSKVAYFKDFDLRTVDTRPSYTMESEEPEFLPARYPIALLNGMASSIGTGFCSNIPPHNFTELCEQTIDLIKDPNAPITLIPDLPTGAAVIDAGQFSEIAETGKGKYTVEATYEIDHENNAIHFTSIPIQVSVTGIIRGITKLKEEKKLEDVKDIRNYTTIHKKGSDVDPNKREHVDLVLELTPDANADKVIERLMRSSVGLRKTYPIELIMIDNFTMKFYSIRSFLLEWLDWRRDYLRSFCNNKLVSTMEEKHINDICINIFGGKNAEKTATAAKKAANAKELMDWLMSEYGITSLQAKVIANMKYSALTSDAYKGYLEKRDEYESLIEKYRKMLSDDQLIDKEIISQLEEGIKLFGGPRRSPIIRVGAANVPDTKHVIAISKDGYIKKISPSGNVGTVGNTKDRNYNIIHINNRSTIVAFDDRGYMATIPVSIIPNAKQSSIGYPLSRYCNELGTVVHVMEKPTINEIKKYGYELILMTESGFGKRVAMKSFEKLAGYQSVINLSEGDKLVDVVLISNMLDMEYLIYTNKGRGLLIDPSEIALLSRSATGSRQIDMDPDEVVTGSTLSNPDLPYMVYVTAAGKIKITEKKYLPKSKRRGPLLALIDIGDKDQLVGIASADAHDKITVYRKNNDPEIIRVSDLPVSTRIAKAPKVVKLPKGDIILDFTITI